MATRAGRVRHFELHGVPHVVVSFPIASGGAAGLTPAEQRVVAAALAGASNDDIARDLARSVRTVENLLARAYKKLGVRSRTELAAKVG